MLFGRKNNNEQAAIPSFGSTKRKKVGSQSEIELACRDLMLASLESMRKDVISRPEDVKPARGESELSFDLADDNDTDSEEFVETDYASENASDIIKEDNLTDCASPQEACTGNCCEGSGKFEQFCAIDAEKQRIIDIIAAEDIRRAFSSGLDAQLG